MERLFTPAQANKTLPLVKRIVADILAKGQELRAFVDVKRDDEVNRQIDKLEDILREHMSELEQVGCHYKDWGFELGLVDFPAKIDERDVYLCWRSDEAAVTWYHPVEEGFAGRRPIPDELLAE